MMLRCVGSALAGLLMSVLLFVFMLRLLADEAVPTQIDQAVTRMEFVELPPPPEPEQEQTQAEAGAAAEPASTSNLMPVMALTPVSQSLPSPPLAAQPDWQALTPDVPAPSSSGPVPVSAAGFDAGKKGKGYIEVVPLATRRPNIPERAWHHKIDGWVLVAFTLKADGRTANVRVLDAQPGGVFEQSVISAVEDWLYDMGNLKQQGDIVLTQKIELFWRDYPDNSPYLD